MICWLLHCQTNENKMIIKISQSLKWHFQIASSVQNPNPSCTVINNQEGLHFKKLKPNVWLAKKKKRLKLIFCQLIVEVLKIYLGYNSCSALFPLCWNPSRGLFNLSDKAFELCRTPLLPVVPEWSFKRPRASVGPTLTTTLLHISNVITHQPW